MDKLIVKTYGMQTRLQHGFTLVELMVTIAILGILLAIGVPLTSAWIDRIRADNAATSLKAAIFDARILALRNKENLASDAVSTMVYVGEIVKDDGNKDYIVGVYQANSTTDCSDKTVLIKQFSISNDIKVNDLSQACYTFDANGMLKSGTSLSNIKVSKNHEYTTLDIL